MLGAGALKEQPDRKARLRAEQEVLNREKEGTQLSCGWEHSVESILYSTLYYSRNLMYVDCKHSEERIFHPSLKDSNHHNMTRLLIHILLIP
jgi:hypothetical protein